MKLICLPPFASPRAAPRLPEARQARRARHTLHA